MAKWNSLDVEVLKQLKLQILDTKERESMNKHEQLVHSSFPKQATPHRAHEGSQSPVPPNIGMMQPEDAPTPMLNPHNPAEYGSSGI